MSAQMALPLAATVSNAPAALVQSPRRCPRRATAFLRSCTIPIFSQGNRVPTGTKAQPAVPEPFLAHFLNQRFLRRSLTFSAVARYSSKSASLGSLSPVTKHFLFGEGIPRPRKREPGRARHRGRY